MVYNYLLSVHYCWCLLYFVKGWDEILEVAKWFDWWMICIEFMINHLQLSWHIRSTKCDNRCRRHRCNYRVGNSPRYFVFEMGPDENTHLSRINHSTKGRVYIVTAAWDIYASGVILPVWILLRQVRIIIKGTFIFTIELVHSIFTARPWERGEYSYEVTNCYFVTE